MGYMHDGVWEPGWKLRRDRGRFQRPASVFRASVTADGSSPHAPEAGRYHLYVSYACPWANRTLILRRQKGLEQAIDVSVVDPRMGEEGWVFRGRYEDAFDGSTEDTVSGSARLQDVYLAADPRYTGRVTVPVLWDRKLGTIVNNESRDIMRMLSRELESLATSSVDTCPRDMERDIDAALDSIYEPINNGVYRCGFASTQEAYEEACRELFDALDRWDSVLAEQKFLCGDRITEADVAFYTTLARFDLVYYSHFKCNLRRIADYSNLSRYLGDLYGSPGFGDTTRLDHIKVHYYWSQDNLNPSRIVPLGPMVDFASR